ncbi:NAD-dependent epimerase/dehydratase family protein [Dokdonella sp.]|uniref:NAD-dependent epimerase/dehydratase family protein n=1 Tax=Dokdonella sp. TaxID=2291710 RepID=UPI0025C6961B|nr:NAD-dependent epimerase/dehydratase family protein [Dokdonella sp.]MBX3691056.1 NAD-dependent epimerase/dehydratase family protein [Dokdonella sp.]MCW5566915.1 NAD-dependent epimerase/dehydratase family protein [Dokdonella sp.]
MRVLVTGATGFLGGHLLDALRAEGAQVAAYVRSADAAQRLRAAGVEAFVGALDDGEALRTALSAPTDALFHVAADTSPWRGHAERQTRTNVDGTRAVLAAAEATGVRRFVHTSSVSAYGRQDCVLTEDTPRLGAQSWINYERTKAIAEELVDEASTRGRIETVILNPAHILGPDDRHNWARLFLLIDQGKLPGAPPGSGTFADVREVALAHVAAWRRPVAGKRFLLGGEHAPFLELVRVIAGTLGRKAPAQALPAALLRAHARMLDLIAAITRREPSLTPQAVALTCYHLRVDSARAMRELDYRITPLARLVADTCDWLRAQGLLQAR